MKISPLRQGVQGDIKIVVAVGLAFSLSFLVGCGNKSLVEQGKAAIKQGNYEEATAIFKAASEEDSKDKEKRWVECDGLKTYC